MNNVHDKENELQNLWEELGIIKDTLDKLCTKFKESKNMPKYLTDDIEKAYILIEDVYNDVGELE